MASHLSIEMLFCTRYACEQISRSQVFRMALGRVVPWADWEEWEEVRTGIFSEDLTLRRAAVDRVNPYPCNNFLYSFA
jgi:hypothetical protein